MTVEKIVWDFEVVELANAIKDFRALFEGRSFPGGTTITKVTKHPDSSFSFETLLTWPESHK